MSGLVRLPVLSKPDFYRRFMQGEFGNRGPTWTSGTYADWHIRYLGATPPPPDHRFMLRSVIPGSRRGYAADLLPYQVQAAWLLAREELTISLMCPHHKQTINGEIQRDHRGLSLYFSEVKEPMRSSLEKGGRQVFGLEAEMVLRRNLIPKDLEWLKYLLDVYPGHVVEFTAFTIRWGTEPRSQCVIWEVRNY